MMGKTIFQGLLLWSMLVPGQSMTSMSLRHNFLEAAARRVPEQLHCADLTNQGTHSTVEVSVGTPPQRFDLIADTGSNAVIILSCACVESGSCSSEDHCFRGQDESSTFSTGKLAANEEPSVTISFGSGDIRADIATDEVSVGGVKAHMEDGVLLMVDKALNIGGPFEGILGLGLPEYAQWRHDSHDLVQKSGKHSKRRSHYTPPRFLAEAGVSRFSICFNNDAGGALRFGTEDTLDMHRKLGSFGQKHWGVSLDGVYVGKTKVPVDVCQADYDDGGFVPDEESSACGGIVDSGTTAIMAPETSLKVLFESICDEWDRCGTAAHELHLPKAHAFVHVLAHCGSWLDDEDSGGLAELPTLHFHVRGSEHGQARDLALDGWFYVFEVEEEKYEELVSEHLTAFTSPRANHTLHANHTARSSAAGDQRVCVPAFSAMHRPRTTNEDTWIFGTSFFYKYDVHYDLDDVSMSFEDGKQCGSCSEGTNLVSHGARFDSSVLARSPRQVSGPWRTLALE